MILDQSDVTPDALAREMDDIARRMHLDAPEQALRFPKFFQLETTRLCNARCPFCAIDKWDKSVPYMAEALFEKIAAELEQHADWVEFVAVQRAGEPLLDKKIAERVGRLKRAGIRRVSMSTNASLLTPAKAEALLAAGLDEMMMSIDSVDRETYGRMRVRLDYDTVIRNIRDFFRIRDAVRPATVIRVRGVSFHHTDEARDRAEMAAWEAFWDELRGPQDRIYLKRAHNWGNQVTWDGHTPEFGRVFHPCILPWSTMHITTMGTVPLCPQDYDGEMALGDVNTHSIVEIWNAAPWNRVRALHREGRREEISFCRGCRLFDPEMSLENWQQKQAAAG